jgi:sugar transferase (PEP-CTERM system associated)
VLLVETLNQLAASGTFQAQFFKDKQMLKVFQLHVSISTFVGMIADVLLCFFAVLLAASTAQALPGTGVGVGLSPAHAFLYASGFSATMSLLYAFVGLYRPTPIGLGSMMRRTVFALIVGGYLTYLMLEYTANGAYAGQLMRSVLVYLVIGLVLVRGAMFVMRKMATTPRVLIVGTGPEAQSVAKDLLTLKRIEREVVGFFETSSQVTPSIPDAGVHGYRVFSGQSLIEDIVKQHRVDEIIVAVREQRGGGVPMDQLLACRIRGIPILDLAGFYERAKSEVPIDSLKASWLVYGHGFVQGSGRRFAKRVFDMVTSVGLLLLACPVMLLTMLAIKLDSPGPVVYRQERVGLGGRSFMCLKFRSMRVDAEKDGVARWASKNDTRVTRVGAIIRKTRIDELPQLLSVLRGEMSMVGPRPERPSFVKQLKEQIPFYDVRHSIKPGVTGWAQVRYSYGASVDDARKKHQYDLYYVKNNSLLLDLLVLIETVSVVLFREGAH